MRPILFSATLTGCVALAAWLTVTLFMTGAAFAGAVGFTVLQVPDGSNPPIEVGLWYPAQGTPRATRVGLFTQALVPDGVPLGRNLPLVVISHGNGGDFAGHSDTALALAEAGFVVAAPTHTGDNYRDQSRALDLPGRVRQLSAVIGAVTAAWMPGAVDAARIGAFGFSAGGLTVLIAAGGEPDLRRIGPHCAAHPSFFDCRLIAARTGTAAPAGAARGAPFPHDPRIRAIAVAAPALGFAFDAGRLRAVTVPVQLWGAGDDAVLPDPFYAEAVRSALPSPPEFHLVPHAGHFDFLAPCSAALARVAPPICTSEVGFDRAGFHRAFDAALIGFFTRTLRPDG